MAGQRLRLPKLKRRMKRQSLTRSMYSSLVDSFEQSPSRKSNDSQQQEQQFWEPADSKNREDSVVDTANGDGAHMENFADMGRENVGTRRTARARPPSMSLSQGFSSSARRSVSHTIGAVGHPVTVGKLPGPMGFVMAFAVAALGVKTAVAKQGAPQRVCEKCEGYGVQQCHICQGRGVLIWEGKLRHTDPCPLCFGKCLKKCSNCGGIKMKKGLPPALVSKVQLLK